MNTRNYFRLVAEGHPSAGRWAFALKPFLSAGSLFYRAGVSVHRSLYQVGMLKRHAFQLPVISVGNLVWGGAGKTPLVEHIARFYLNRAKTPLILARGYGEDESKELARKLPEARFGIGKDRFKAGGEALRSGPADVIILDDGFQHWRLHRNLDIVVINALNPFGNWSLIPHGILREPLAALKRASMIVLNDVNLKPRQELDRLKKTIREIAGGQAPFVEAYHEPLYFYRPYSRERLHPERLEGERVTSFSGIGTPRSFQMLLNHIGLKTARNFEFCDHHMYTEQELKEIRDMKESSGSEEIVTTEKDFFRCEELMNKIFRPLVLKVRLRFTSGEDVLARRLDELVQNGKMG